MARTPRRNRRRKDARPGEILDAALTEFAVRGYEGTRLEDVAAGAGIAKGTIYLYFENKEALFRAVLQQVAGRELDAVEALIDGYTGPAAELLRLFIHQMGRRLVDSELRHLLRLLIAEGPRFPDLLAFHHAEIVGRGRKIIARVVRHGVERGEFRDNGLDRFPQVLIAGPMTAMLWEALFSNIEPLDVDAYLEALADTLLHGLLH